MLAIIHIIGFLNALLVLICAIPLAYIGGRQTRGNFKSWEFFFTILAIIPCSFTITLALNS